MSFSASGSLAQFITFSQRKSGQQVRWQKKQKDSQTENQLVQRNKLVIASDSVRYCEPGVIVPGNYIMGLDRDDLNSSAMGRSVSGYNLGIKENLVYLN